MLTIQIQTRAGKIFKCTIFVGYGGVIFFLLVSHQTMFQFEVYIINVPMTTSSALRGTLRLNRMYVDKSLNKTA